MRGQQWGRVTASVLRSRRRCAEGGPEVQEPNAGGREHGGRRRGLPLRVQHAVLAGREPQVGQVGPVTGHQGRVRAGKVARGDLAGRPGAGPRVDGRGLGRPQAVRGRRAGPENRRGRAKARRPVALRGAQQQPDRPVGHSVGPHARVRVRGRRQPAGPRQHGWHGHQGDRHRGRVPGVRRGRGHPRAARVLVRLAAEPHRDRGLRG